MTDDLCTESGCAELGRWAHDGRIVCRSRAIDRAIRSGIPAELRSGLWPVLDIWDELQAELVRIPFAECSEREQRLREIAWSAIEAGRAASGGSGVFHGG